MDKISAWYQNILHEPKISDYHKKFQIITKNFRNGQNFEKSAKNLIQNLYKHRNFRLRVFNHEFYYLQSL